MRRIAEYINRYEGRRFVIVGKGPTKFRYENLSEIRDPIIFINDAVQFEHHATAAPETFFFAHDPCQAIWLTSSLKSTAILPAANSLSSDGTPMISVESLGASCEAGQVASYVWNNKWRREQGRLKDVSREQLAVTNELFISCGTIHSAIHFAWLCGAIQVIFVGCDGFTNPVAPQQAYDKRISVDSGGKPKGVFNRIRVTQDKQCEMLRLNTLYVNEHHIDSRIPRIAHFVWIGKWEQWVGDNIALFQRRHPGWDIKVWRSIPPSMPLPLLRACGDASQLCQLSDLISYWALWKYGGIYLDADMVTVRNMEPLLRFDAWGCRTHCSRVNCAALGSVPCGKAITRILDKAIEIAHKREDEKLRTRFGPAMLTELFGREGLGDEDFAILPRHYFYLLVDSKQAGSWWRADEFARKAIMEQQRGHIVDPSPPYAVHLWGVDGSGHRPTYGHGQALVGRLLGHPGHPLVGAEVGVLAGKLSVYLFNNLPGLTLYMVDFWDGGESGRSSYGGRIGGSKDKATALKETKPFAKRRIVLHGASTLMAAEVGTATLDFVFIDADHEYSAVKADIEAWYPTVKPGGIIAGHDYENPIGVHDSVQRWDVRRAVAEFRKEHGIETPLELGGGTTWFFEKPVEC